MALPVPQNMNVDTSSKSAAEAGDIVGASRVYDFSGPRVNSSPDWTMIAIAGAAVAVAFLAYKGRK